MTGTDLMTLHPHTDRIPKINRFSEQDPCCSCYQLSFLGCRLAFPRRRGHKRRLCVSLCILPTSSFPPLPLPSSWFTFFKLCLDSLFLSIRVSPLPLSSFNSHHLSICLPLFRMVNAAAQLTSKDGHFVYPAAPRSDVKETTHGITVADPYRWLEDPEADATKSYVDAQNALATTYLSKFEGRQKLHAR